MIEIPRPGSPEDEFEPKTSLDSDAHPYLSPSEPFFAPAASAEDIDYLMGEIEKIFAESAGQPVAKEPDVTVTVIPPDVSGPDDFDAPGPHRRDAKASVWRKIFGRHRGGGRHR